MRIIRININKYPLILIFEIKKYSNFYRVIFFRINIHRLSILTKPMFLGDYDLNFRQNVTSIATSTLAEHSRDRTIQ